MNNIETSDIVGFITDQVEEFIDYQYISECLAISPTDRYRHMEASAANMLLNVVKYTYESITEDEFGIDEVLPEIAAKILFRDGSYDSIEFIRVLMSGYEKQLERYKEIRTGEITKEMRLSADIERMTKPELRIAIAKAHGIKVVHETFPCQMVDGEMFAIEGPLSHDYCIEDYDHFLWPVTSVSGDVSKQDFEPLLDYPGDIMKALYLSSDLKTDGFVMKTQQSITDESYRCTFRRNTPYETNLSASSASLPEAICMAYLKVFLFEINPDARERVFPREAVEDVG